MPKHPHHPRTEKVVIWVSPVTLGIGTGMVIMAGQVVSIMGIVLATVSISAFALVHCVRANRLRRQRHQKQNVCWFGVGSR
jgi:threonine/homoserine efflux transporter RhtA